MELFGKKYKLVKKLLNYDSNSKLGEKTGNII